MKLDVAFTWGDGPDMILSIDDKKFELSAEQAKKLICKLQSAVCQVEEIEMMARNHDELFLAQGNSK